MTKKTNTAPKGKRTLSSLKTRPFRLHMVHPTEGDLGGYIDLVSSQTNAYFYKAVELAKAKADETTIEDQIRQAAELAATVMIGWDEEFFEQPFSNEAAVAILSEVENFWIRDLVQRALEDNSNFFQKL